MRVCAACMCPCLYQSYQIGAGGTPPVGTNAIFSTVSVLRLDPIRGRTLCVEQPQLGYIRSACMGERISVHVSLPTCNQSSLPIAISSLTTCWITRASLRRLHCPNNSTLN